MINKNLKSNSGYTLMELILYISLFSIMIAGISISFSLFFDSKIKNQTITEVDQEGAQVLEIITQTIRNANNVNSPIIGSSDGTLSLGVDNIVLNPTIFSLSGGEIKVTEGLNPEISLTNNLRVVASDLLFENLSRNLTPDIISISFTLTHLNPNGRNEYDYSKTFYGSASLRY